MMPELKLLLLTIIQDLINSLVQNISEIHKFFPLKDSVSNIVYLYLTDSKVNIQDISLENLNVSITLLIVTKVKCYSVS